jgi:hypothetical protein
MWFLGFYVSLAFELFVKAIHHFALFEGYAPASAHSNPALLAEQSSLHVGPK